MAGVQADGDAGIWGAGVMRSEGAAESRDGFKVDASIEMLGGSDFIFASWSFSYDILCTTRAFMFTITRPIEVLLDSRR